MQSVKEMITFSTTVSDSTDPNDFLIQFSSCDSSLDEETPIMLTKNFNELIDFLEQLDQ